MFIIIKYPPPKKKQKSSPKSFISFKIPLVFKSGMDSFEEEYGLVIPIWTSFHLAFPRNPFLYFALLRPQILYLAFAHTIGMPLFSV